MAVQNLMLAAHALGLGSCMLTAPLLVSEVVVRELNLPIGDRPREVSPQFLPPEPQQKRVELTPLGGYDLTCLLALGYPDETPAQPRRKSIEQIAEFREDGDELE
jgi:nitroreductase